MKIPLVIIGGGIIGLTLGYYLSKAYPELEFIIIDKEKNLGDETTGRNSGVLHAGIYYKPGSLKHKLCLEGNMLWRELRTELQLDILECGKYIICSQKEDEESFYKLFDKAQRINKVPGIRLCEDSETDKFKEYVNIHKAFISETTGVLDVPDTISKLETYLYNKNIPILKDSNIFDVKNCNEDGFLITTSRDEFYAEQVINCAGLGGVSLRKKLGLTNLSNFFVKGHYIKLNKPFYNKALLYPMPPSSGLGLGVHTSFSVDGIIKFGPDTQEVSEIDYKMDEERISEMFPCVNEVFKDIKLEDLSLDYCGIRPKIKLNDEVYDDFWIAGESRHKIKNYTEILGIESPGLTAAPAIANLVITMLKI